MKISTLCYIECGGKTLMLHRTKKKNDENAGKWIGIGGKVQEGESPEECLLREVFEETGIKLNHYKLRGIITFVSDKWETEYMFLFSASCDSFTVSECDEGDLRWVKNEQLGELPMWEGDKVFFRLLRERADFFSLKLIYEGEHLTDSIVY